MKKIFIYISALILAFAVIFNSGCIADGICYLDCVNRENNCIDDCIVKYPDKTSEQDTCIEVCGFAYGRCMERCDELIDK